MEKYKKPCIKVVKVHVSKIFSCSSFEPRPEKISIEYDKSNEIWGDVVAD